MPTRQELLQRIEASRSDLDRLVLSLTPDQFQLAIDGGWTVKDHVAHVACWEEELLAIFAGIPRHESLGVLDDSPILTDTDAINGILRARWSQATSAAVVEHFEATHQRVRSLLDSLSDNELHRPISQFVPVPGEIAQAPVHGWVAGNTWEHYAEHAEAIRRLVALGS